MRSRPSIAAPKRVGSPRPTAPKRAPTVTWRARRVSAASVSWSAPRSGSTSQSAPSPSAVDAAAGRAVARSARTAAASAGRSIGTSSIGTIPSLRRSGRARAALSGGNSDAALAESRAGFRRTCARRLSLNRHMLIGLAVGLVVGIFIGYQAGSSNPPPPATGAMGGGMPPGAAPGMPPGGPGGAPAPNPGDNFQARITAMQAVVARDPKNFDAWVQLGNDYFDTRQPQKAIDAYSRALELRPNTANVLTDQGVMYRDVGQFDRAIANFTKANQVDPKHVQSLYNLGVVYLNDLKQPKKAIEVWNKVIQAAPQSEQAAQSRAAIEEAKKIPGAG